MLSKYKSVVFVCTGNTCRSVMAEYYFRKRVLETKQGPIMVSSAGTAGSPAFKVPGIVIRLLKNEGIKFIDHSSTTITEKIAEENDLILCMENHQELSLKIRFPKQKDKIFLLYAFARGRRKDILDPIAQNAEFYELTFNDIKDCINSIIGDVDE